MNGFKLLAIRPLKGCSERFSKVLEPGRVYNFYNYNFEKEDEDDMHSNIISVTPNQLLNENIYNITHANINISAVVGKNGSGKSTLIELLFMSVYMVGVKKIEKLDDIPGHEKRIAKTNTEFNKWKKEQATKEKSGYYYEQENEYEDKIKKHKQLITEIKDFNKKLKVELFYSVGDTIFCLNIDNGSLYQSLFTSDETKKRKYKIAKLSGDSPKSHIFFIEDFFYSIAMNYSSYGLNSVSNGYWIEELFHKNDGYQTPVVINPMRTRGIYDINLETHLCQTRILSNLVDEKMEVKTLIEQKEVKKIVFECNANKVEDTVRSTENKIVANYGKQIQEVLFKKIYQALTKEEYIDKEIVHLQLLKKYAIKKVVKISRIYDEYRKLYISLKEKYNEQDIRTFESLVEQLKLDNSHKTLKLRQAVNIIRFNILEEDSSKGIKWENNKISFTIDELIRRVKEGVEKGQEKEAMMPVAFFKPKIIFANSKFEFLSSGEQQLVNTLQNVYYHLLNINSVKQSENRSASHPVYRNVNIIFDEVELYFHPEFQRKFVKELIDGLKKLELHNVEKDEKTNINIIFSTHSPFILSDIPESNCMFLEIEKGKALTRSGKELDGLKTFGANIHDMLRNGFFMKNGTMGEFAKIKILDQFSKLNKAISNNKNVSKSEIDKMKNFANAVAEPLIRKKLLDRIKQLKRTDLETEKNELEERLQEINRQLSGKGSTDIN